MISAMLMAHLVADYVLQWNKLALWKSRAYGGVLLHGGIVIVTTLLFAIAIKPDWWPWALLIGLIHLLIDAAPVWLQKRQIQIAALPRFVIDQLLHGLTILIILIISGNVTLTGLLPQISWQLQDYQLWLYLLGYTFLTMPAWVLLQFLVYALVNGSDPDFARAPNKYLVSLERTLIATFVLLGQFLLIPLVALPRLLLVQPTDNQPKAVEINLAEWLASLATALLIGLALRLV